MDTLRKDLTVTGRKPTRYDVKGAAEYLDRPVGTLRHWRLTGVGPRSYVVLEGRQERVYYDEPDLAAFKALMRKKRHVRGDVAATPGALSATG